MIRGKLEGRCIRKVHLTRFSGRQCVEAIEFTDGSFLEFVTVEDGYEYGSEPVYPAKGPASPAAPQEQK